MMWSTVALIGCGYFRDLSTGFPQIPQIDWVAIIIFRFASNCARYGPFLSGLVRLLLAIVFPSRKIKADAPACVCNPLFVAAEEVKRTPLRNDTLSDFDRHGRSAPRHEDA